MPWYIILSVRDLYLLCLLIHVLSVFLLLWVIYIVLCICYPGTTNYPLLGCPLSGIDILCIAAVEIGTVRYINFDDSCTSQIFFGMSSPKSKAEGWLPTSHEKHRSSSYSCRNLHVLATLLTPWPRTGDFLYQKHTFFCPK